MLELNFEMNCQTYWGRQFHKLNFKNSWKHIILVCILINCSLWSEPPIHLVTYGPLTNVFTFFTYFGPFPVENPAYTPGDFPPESINPSEKKKQ